MGPKILRDLFCFQCSYQFDKRSIYDKDQTLVHNHEEKKGFQTEIKIEVKEISMSKESDIGPNNKIENYTSQNSKTEKLVSSVQVGKK